MDKAGRHKIVKILKYILLIGGIIAGTLLVRYFVLPKSRAEAVLVRLTSVNTTYNKNQEYVASVFVDTKGQSITAAQVELQWDTNYLDVLEITNANYLPVTLINGAISGNKASITLGAQVTASGATPKNGTGVLANIRFRTKTQSGTSQISFTSNTQVAAVGSTVNVLGTAEALSITIAGATPTPSPISATPTPPSGGTDLTEGGTASDNGATNPAGQGEVEAFDNNTSNKWLVLSPTGFIQYDFSGTTSHAVNRYTITSGDDFPGRDPRNWQFQGSNDGTSWVTLDTKTGITFASRTQTQSFTISNTTAYQIYRVNITANNGEPYTQLSEIQMFAGATVTASPSPTPTKSPSPTPTPTSTGTLRPADVNSDGLINIIDIGIIIDNYGRTTGFYPRSDVNSDGIINIIDIGIVIDNYGA